jgi:GNAT superfamily N-acetyltransferase
MADKVKKEYIDIVGEEVRKKLPHWLHPTQRFSEQMLANQRKHRAKWLQERKDADAAKARIKLKEWDEAKHPRDPAGKFSESGGGAAGEAESAVAVKPVAAPAAETSGGGKKKAEVADFTKADIALDSATRVDTEKRQKFLQSWNDKIGEAPEEFKKEFLGGLPATMHINYHDYNDSLELRGTLLNASGTSIGSYTRTIDLKKNKASSDYFKIHDEKQGGGIGKKLLAANVEMYRKLGLDRVDVHANIDVGGYAWARYGYVPTQASWNALRHDLLDKLERSGGLRGGYTAESWDEISSYDQDVIKDVWMRSTRDEFIQSEIESWRGSGRALDDAKVQLAELYDTKHNPEWALAGLDEWHDKLPDDAKIPFTDQQILAAVSIKYNSRYDDGSNDPDIEFDDSKLIEPAGYDPKQQTLPGIEPIKPHEALTEDMRSGIEKALVKAFNDKAERDADNIDPPDFSDTVADYQSEYWDGMRDRDKFEWARDNGSLPEVEPESDDGEKIDDPEVARNAVEHLLNSLDPKALWAVADSDFGKSLLLGTDWNGAIDFHDKETMDRFNAYVGRKK